MVSISSLPSLLWKKRSAIVVIIGIPHVSDRSDHSISQRSLKSSFYMIATIAEPFFFRDHRARSVSYGNQPLFSMLFDCLPVRLSSRCSFALMPLINNTSPNCLHDSSSWVTIWFNYSFMINYLILTCTIHVFIFKIR